MLGLLNYTSPVSYSSHELDLPRRPELWRCRECSSWYTNNILPKDVAEGLYKTGSSGSRWTPTPLEQGKSLAILKQLSAVFRADKKVLDIGCNTGELLDFARSRGCNTAGVEFSESCHGPLAEKGHGCFAELGMVTGRYDVITAFDVIEHVYDPPRFFSMCRDLLEDDGVLVLLTGNIHSMCARLCGPYWWYVNFPEHIGFPSGKFLRNTPGFKLQRQIRTYASLDFVKPIPVVIKRFLLSLYRNGRYAGLPSPIPDHVLVCLSKV